ncbi:ABC-type transport auxiliary lipoprotein family protein [Vibrio sp. S4M6]|uniref:PqiC family protein n=1 Tax=Vibrio sinus TaxID=2946865 RepID=UPI00202A7434|nr:ABC-type transport auxiliary lipoprotein family protein [Vibrio sinus]MCL9779828.1 ABC-type transport auxiliary lipoprotein family protein [Vibrio sinus]
MTRQLWIMIIAVFLSSCASTSAPVSQEYLLPDHTSVSAYQGASTDKDLAIQVKPIKVADYLKRLNIVMVNNDGKVYQAANHLWAEPLASQLESLTMDRLEQRVPSISWLPSSQPLLNAMTLQIDVSNFYANFQGEIIVSGRWYLVSDSNKLIKSGQFNKTTKLKKDGYTAMTDQLSLTWLSEVIDPIAVKVSQM